MPNFSSLSVTNLGLELITQAAAGLGTITFVNVQVGSGAIPSGFTPATMTGLATPVGTAEFDGANTAVLYQASLRITVSSAISSSAYQLNEIGIFASFNGGSPVLFAYANANGTGDNITPAGSGAPVLYEYDLLIPFSQSTPTNAIVSPTTEVQLHGPTHVSNPPSGSGFSPVDPIPNATATSNGLLPALTGAVGNFLNYLGQWAMVDWNYIINKVVATTAAIGCLPKLSGVLVQTLRGDGSWKQIDYSEILNPPEAANPFEPGFIRPYAGTKAQFLASSIASEWLWCDASVYPISEYPALGAFLGGQYGGNGTTTFAVPTGVGTVLVGAGAGLTIGSTGGEQAHTLTQNELAEHTHAAEVNEGAGHNHPIDLFETRNILTGGTNNIFWPVAPGSGVDTINTDKNTTGLTVSNSNAGGGASHNNMQPYCVVGGYIIKT